MPAVGRNRKSRWPSSAEPSAVALVTRTVPLLIVTPPVMLSAVESTKALPAPAPAPDMVTPKPSSLTMPSVSTDPGVPPATLIRRAGERVFLEGHARVSLEDIAPGAMLRYRPDAQVAEGLRQPGVDGVMHRIDGGRCR